VEAIGMRGYVGVTDGDWYRFLADRPQDLRAVLLQDARAGQVKPAYGGEHRLDTDCCSAPTHVMFGNGASFYAKAGEVITLADRRADRPNPDFLRWHLDNVFKAA
jgi:hypothetical protein